MKVFLFHCWGGDGRSCWSGWLADELRAKGIEVIAPDFPERANPHIEDWLTEVRNKVKTFDPKDEWILIGHSLGCPTILRLLETFTEKEKVKGIILVAGFAKDLMIPELQNFVYKPFDWEKIKSKAKKVFVINSDNDPFIELSEGERLAKMLGCEMTLEPKAGHINEGSGFKKYDRLLQIINSIN
ncbi:alpha/beta fold hydrolase [Candidatus Micrarchaeota archaeon]|nr:alpha/beta fold hydrolase [Candidatus Micrarchaeota archaeon]